ncbi:MAG: LuxR C-terminal-related transcriptional regulator [Vicinamibacterales bacterium]
MSVVHGGPDLLVMPLSLLDRDDAVDDLHARVLRPTLPVIFLADLVEHADVVRATKANGAGIVLRPFDARQLVASAWMACEAGAGSAHTTRSGPPLSTDEKLRAIAAIVNGPSTTTVAATNDPLSAREREIVELLANGARVVTIARQLRLSPHTVRNHLKSVFRKLNLRGQHELFE